MTLHFPRHAPETDLDKVRDRVVGILFGLVVVGLAFKYIWPDHALGFAAATAWQANRLNTGSPHLDPLRNN